MLRLSRLSRAALLPALLAVAACDSGGETVDVDGVLVGNQGTFGNDASGTVTVADADGSDARALALPDGLVQDVVVVDGDVFVLRNFSDSFTTGRGRIDVLDGETLAVTAQIEAGTPRGMAVAAGTAFVPSLYGAAVTPISLATLTAGTPIPVGDNPEGIAAVGTRVYVANSGFGAGSTLSVIDAATQAVVETVELGCAGPNDVLADGDGDVWVLCTGASDFTTGEVTADGQVVTVDGATGAVVARDRFAGETIGGAALGTDLAFDRDRNAVFALQSRAGADDRVVRYDAGANVRGLVLDVGGADVAGIAVGDGRIYLGRLDAANPFSDDGEVTVHTIDGTQTASFGAGVIPAAFALQIDR